MLSSPSTRPYLFPPPPRAAGKDGPDYGLDMPGKCKAMLLKKSPGSADGKLFDDLLLKVGDGKCQKGECLYSKSDEAGAPPAFFLCCCVKPPGARCGTTRCLAVRKALELSTPLSR